MGFFRGALAEEEAELELFLKLDTVGVDLSMSATVMECRLSADSENRELLDKSSFYAESRPEDRSTFGSRNSQTDSTART